MQMRVEMSLPTLQSLTLGSHQLTQGWIHKPSGARQLLCLQFMMCSAGPGTWVAGAESRPRGALQGRLKGGQLGPQTCLVPSALSLDV